jgi:hypothetical protein
MEWEHRVYRYFSDRAGPVPTVGKYPFVGTMPALSAINSPLSLMNGYCRLCEQGYNQL